MLTKTFLHLPGIGRRSEQRLWDACIGTWQDLAASIDEGRALFDHRASLLGRARIGAISHELELSEEALGRLDGAYFAKRLPASEHWRVLPEFAAKTVYLDIETTGLSRVYDDITMVGWHAADGYDARISGHDLHRLADQLEGYEVIVTFNGATFDLPFLRHAYPELKLPPIHVDLRYVLRRLGLFGGLNRSRKTSGFVVSGRMDSMEGTL